MRVPDDYAGVAMNCPGCGGTLKVPTMDEAKASGAYAPAGAPAAGKPSPSSSPSAAPSKPAAAESKPAAPAPFKVDPPAPSKSPAFKVAPPAPSKPPAFKVDPPAPSKSPAAKVDPPAPSKSPAFKVDPPAPSKSPAAKVAPPAPSKSPAFKVDPPAPSKSPAAKVDPPAPSKSPAFKVDPPAPSKSPAAKAPAEKTPVPKAPARSASDDPFADLEPVSSGESGGLNVDLSGLDDLGPPADLGAIDTLLGEPGSSADLGMTEFGPTEMPAIQINEPASKGAAKSEPAAAASKQAPAKAAPKPTPAKTPRAPRAPGKGVPALAIDAGLALLALAASVGVFFAVAPPTYARPAIAMVRGQGQPSGAVTIRIEGDNTIRISGKQLSGPEAVAAELRAAGSARQVVIEASGEALFDTIERVIAAAGRGGVEQVQLATTEP